MAVHSLPGVRPESLSVSVPTSRHPIVRRITEQLRQRHRTHELLKGILFAAGRPLTADYLADVVRIPKESVLKALMAPPEDIPRGVIILWNGEHAELIIGPEFADEVYTATQTDMARSEAMIDEYLSAQRQRGRRETTLTGYRQFLTRFASAIGKPVDEVETRDIRRFLLREETERGNSRATIASKIHRLSSMYKWLAREEYLERDPMLRIDAPSLPKPEPRYLTHEEIERVRDVASGLDRVIFEVLYSSGIRREEAVKLDWRDLDLSAKTLYVREGKGGVSRTTLLSTRAAMELRAYLSIRDDDDPCVFRSQFKRRMSRESINRRMVNLGKRARLPDRLTPHRLRHSMAKHLRDAEVPLDVIQALLGHVDLRTTQRYSGLPEHTARHYRAVYP